MQLPTGSSKWSRFSLARCSTRAMLQCSLLPLGRGRAAQSYNYTTTVPGKYPESGLWTLDSCLPGLAVPYSYSYSVLSGSQRYGTISGFSSEGEFEIAVVSY
eukprot:scaffold324763_cov41-Prasinocladus_malaysianus.AAC.1